MAEVHEGPTPRAPVHQRVDAIAVAMGIATILEIGLMTIAAPQVMEILAILVTSTWCVGLAAHFVGRAPPSQDRPHGADPSA